MVLVWPGFKGNLVARSEPDGLAVTVQPDGPVAPIANVMSDAVPFFRSTLNVYVSVVLPWSSGNWAVSVAVPPASVATRTVIGSVALPPPPRAATLIRAVPCCAPSGTTTSSVTWGAALPFAKTPSISLPPPLNVVRHPSGAPVAASWTWRGEATVMLSVNEAVAPGLATTSGYGVVISTPPAASATGATANADRTAATLRTRSARPLRRDRRDLDETRDGIVPPGDGNRRVVLFAGAPAIAAEPLISPGGDDSHPLGNQRIMSAAAVSPPASRRSSSTRVGSPSMSPSAEIAAAPHAQPQASAVAGPAPSSVAAR